PHDLRRGISPAELFRDWMEILRGSNASQFNKLHVAYRVSPLLTADASRTASDRMVVDDRSLDTRYEEPALQLDDVELGLFLGLRLELPLCETLEAADLLPFIPPDSPFSPVPRTGLGAPLLPPIRRLSLLTLIDPTPEEAVALGRIDQVGILTRLKSLA